MGKKTKKTKKKKEEEGEKKDVDRAVFMETEAWRSLLKGTWGKVWFGVGVGGSGKASPQTATVSDLRSH